MAHGMRGWLRQKWNTLGVRIFFICTLMFAALMAIFLCYGVYDAYRYRKELQTSNNYVAEVYAGRYNTELESLDNYASSIYMENVHFRMLQRSGLTEKERIGAEYHLVNLLSSKAYALQRYGCLFYYDAERQRLRSCYSTWYSSEQKYVSNLALKARLISEPEPVRQHMITIDGRNCYMKLYGSRDFYIGYFVDLEQYFLDVSDWQSAGVQLLVCDDAGDVRADYGAELIPEERFRSLSAEELADMAEIVSVEPLYGGCLRLVHVQSFGRPASF